MRIDKIEIKKPARQGDASLVKATVILTDGAILKFSEHTFDVQAWNQTLASWLAGDEEDLREAATGSRQLPLPLPF